MELCWSRSRWVCTWPAAIGARLSSELRNLNKDLCGGRFCPFWRRSTRCGRCGRVRDIERNNPCLIKIRYLLEMPGIKIFLQLHKSMLRLLLLTEPLKIQKLFSSD